MLLTRTARRASRAKQMAERLARLAEIDVTPARECLGRVLTVVTRPAIAERQLEEIKFDLRQYIRPWWSTVHRCNLRGTLLYSGLSRESVAAIETPRIDAVEVHPGRRHIFHERHFLVRDFLRTIDDPYVLITDASDVGIRRDPFELMRSHGCDRKLFIGREARRILFCRCVRREMQQQFGAVWHPWRPVLNPGILGGRREVVLEALDQITALIAAQADSLDGSDMCLVNRAIHSAFAPQELVTGEPLHSRFKGWEFNTSAAILHK